MEDLIKTAGETLINARSSVVRHIGDEFMDFQMGRYEGIVDMIEALGVKYKQQFTYENGMPVSVGFTLNGELFKFKEV